jgi:hypothetical protein
MVMSQLKSNVTLLLNWYTNPYHTPIIVAQQDETFDISQCYTNRFLPETPYSDLKPIACYLES